MAGGPSVGHAHFAVDCRPGVDFAQPWVGFRVFRGGATGEKRSYCCGQNERFHGRFLSK